MNRESSGYDNLEGMLQDASSEPRNLPVQFLRNITNNFSDELLLGEGGFGTVYKGVLPNGEMIAVKKLSSSMPGVKDKQFKNEAYHLMKLKHPNVVLLVGWCSETEDVYVKYNGKYICAEKSERLLCLEYMPNGNLREYLKGGASRFCWDICYKIIEGICRGLHYLHEEWQKNTPIIHMDLKPANILLDNNMVPKIADFGLSRLFSEEKTKTCTMSRDGTLGYMAPEYIHKGLITTKSDIFSLGVMILEIVTGHKDYPDETGISSEEFVELELKNWTNRLQNSLVSTILVEIYCQQIRRCIHIGLACVKFDRSKRPTTGQIINVLDGADFGGREEVDQHWASTSEAAHEYASSSSQVKERPSRKRSVEIDLNGEESYMLGSLERRYKSPKESTLVNFGSTLDLGNNKAGSISSLVTADDGKNSRAVLSLKSSAHHVLPRHSEARVTKTSMTKGTYTVDESPSGMDDACNELGSCNASAMECSNKSDSESEIFRVKRRSTSFYKPTSDTTTSSLSEQQVLRRLKKGASKYSRVNKRSEEPDNSSDRSVRTSQKSSNPSSSDDEREDRVPISWRIKLRQFETQHDGTSHGAKLQPYPPSSSCSREGLGPKRVKIRLPSSASRQIEQQRSSRQRFARDDNSNI